MQIYPVPAPDDVVEAWRAAVGDAGITLGEVALIWRRGRPRPTGQEAASWRAGSDIDAEFDDDYEFTPALEWANSDPIRGLPRLMVWMGRTPEGLAGLLRHELEHTVQVAAKSNLTTCIGVRSMRFGSEVAPASRTTPSRRKSMRTVPCPIPAPPLRL